MGFANGGIISIIDRCPGGDIGIRQHVGNRFSRKFDFDCFCHNRRLGERLDHRFIVTDLRIYLWDRSSISTNRFLYRYWECGLSDDLACPRRLQYQAAITNFVLATVVGAVAKFGVLYLTIVQFVVPVLLKMPAPKAAMVSGAFSVPQLITALIGGGLSILVVPVLSKALHRQRVR